MLWWQWILLVVGCLMVIAAIYSAITYTEAKLEVDASPREPMLMCDKHGIYRESHAFEFLDQKMCPVCFHERIKIPLDSSVISK
jgi:hypothetical protein